MDNHRLIYRVILKLMSLTAAVVLLIVLFNSLFTAENEKRSRSNTPVVSIPIQGMKSGEIRKAYWQGREVAVVKRNHRDGIAVLVDDTRPLAHASLDPGFRSRLKDYFVYINTGDSGNCPLYHDARGLRDTCTGRQFDTNGREIGKQTSGALLEIPPYTFTLMNDKAIELKIGRWEE